VPSGSFCGNSLVEQDEECDAGAGNTDKCCNIRCKLKAGAWCRLVEFNVGKLIVLMEAHSVIIAVYSKNLNIICTIFTHNKGSIAGVRIIYGN